MRYIKLMFLWLLITSFCSSVFKESKLGGRGSNSQLTTDHFNITICSDLSNRLNGNLYPKVVSDIDIVQVITECIYPKILNHKRSMNQLDQFRIGFINKRQINAYSASTRAMDIDFAKFKTQGARINYLRNNFKKDKDYFLREFKRIHDNAVKNPFGSDIWTYMQQGVDGFVVNKEVSVSKIGNTRFQNKYRNILILLTDGYIETVFNNKGYDLTGRKIKEFRKQFKRSDEKNIGNFYRKNPIYKMEPLTNPLLKDLEVLVLELYDRTDTNSGASEHPTDMEIMKLIWSDWLKESKVKRVELHSKFSNKSETEKVIMKFLGV